MASTTDVVSRWTTLVFVAKEALGVPKKPMAVRLKVLSLETLSIVGFGERKARPFFGACCFSVTLRLMADACGCSSAGGLGLKDMCLSITLES